MLTCIACSKQLNNGSLHQKDEEEAVQTPSTKQAIKALTAQVNCIIHNMHTHVFVYDKMCYNYVESLYLDM